MCKYEGDCSARIKSCVIDLLTVHEVMTTRRFIMSFICLSFLYLKSSTWNWKKDLRISITMQFAYNLNEEPRRVLNTCLYKCKALSNKRLGEGASTIYCSFESVMNRFLWNIMGFIRQQFCSVCRSKLTFRCCQHSTVLFKYRICCRLVQTSDIPRRAKKLSLLVY